MMRRSVVAVLGALVLALAGCGSSSKSSTSGSESASGGKPNLTVSAAASLKAAFMRSPPSGCSLGPPTSILVTHSSPIFSRSRQTTEPSGRQSYSSCQFSTPSTSSSRS